MLSRCIDSILSQTFTNIELILIDDGSTDDSLKICDHYLNMDERVVVVHKDNGGVGSARNLGLKIAKGDWVVFVDSDDFLCNNCIEELYKGRDFDLVFIGINRYNCDSQNVDEVLHRFKECVINLSTLDGADSIVKYDLLAIGYPWGKLYKKCIIDKYGISFNERINIHEDHLFYYDYLIHCKNLYLSDIIGYNYVYSSKHLSLTCIVPPYDKLLIASDEFIVRYPNLLSHLSINNIDYIRKITSEYGIGTRRKALYSMYYHHTLWHERITFLKKQSVISRKLYFKYGYVPSLNKHLIIFKLLSSKYICVYLKDFLFYIIYNYNLR